MRLPVLAALVASPLLFSLAQSPSNQALGDPISISPGLGFKREPLLVVDVSGGTLAGPFHTSLKVYNDGLVTWAAMGSSVFGTDDEVCTTGISPSVFDQLHKDLLQAGAAKLPDNPQLVTDVPLTTVTFLRPVTNAKAHTFSYYLPTGDWADVGQVIGDFVQDHVNCSGPSISLGD